MVSRLAWLAR
uniref:Uncharacterized protein n=1 Tax=Anguilla anguilla TaxID=7936 RepID=A0A0E9PDZ4_ANGAN